MTHPLLQAEFDRQDATIRAAILKVGAAGPGDLSKVMRELKGRGNPSYVLTFLRTATETEAALQPPSAP